MSVFEYAVCLLAIMLKDKQTISKQMIPIMKMKFEGRATPIAFASQYGSREQGAKRDDYREKHP